MALEAGKVTVVVIWTAWICFSEALNYLLSNCTNTTTITCFPSFVKVHLYM